MKQHLLLFLLFLLCSICLYAQSTFLPNTDSAFKLKYFQLQEAAKKDEPHALLVLGFMHYMGEHVPVSNKLAATYFKRSAKNGNDTAQAMYGEMCYKGEGVLVNKAEAAKWMELSVMQGSTWSVEELAKMYIHGDGVKKDINKAILFLRMGSEKGNIPSQILLGDLYSTDGPQRNPKEAAIQYRKAAENGWSEAQTKLAKAYEYGKGVEKDLAEARKWYTAAIEHGGPDAVKTLDNFNAKYALANKLPTVAENDKSSAVNPYAGKKICQIQIGNGNGHSGALNAYCETVVSEVVNHKALGLPKNVVSSAVFAQDVRFDGFGTVAKNTPVKFFDKLIYLIDGNTSEPEYWQTVNDAILHCLGNPREFISATDLDVLFWGHAAPINIPAGSKIILGYSVLQPAGKYLYEVRALEVVVSKDITVNGVGIVRKGQSIVNKKYPQSRGQEAYDGSIAIQ